MASAHGNTVNVLVIEDDVIAVEAIKRAFREKRILNPIVVANDGLEGLQTLRGEIGSLSSPCIVLLDLNLPRMDGIEFLQHVRNDDRLKQQVVFVLTTSDSDADKLSAYNLNVAGYMVKERVGDEFHRVAELLDLYWRIVELPPQGPIATI